MDITLTLFKRKGDRGADIFVGTFAGPGERPGEWQVLARNRRLRDNGVKFLLIEFEEPEALPKGYAEKVDGSLYIDLRFGSDVDGSLVYPRNLPLKAPNISKWVLEMLSKPRVVVVKSAPVIVEPEPEPEEKSVPAEELTEAPAEDEFTSSWRLPVTIAGASLFVAGCAAIAGVALWRNHDSFQDDCPVLLVDDRDREISNFENVNWDAQVHGDGTVQEAEM